MSISLSSHPKELKLLRQNISPETLVIVVPGIGTAGPQTWFQGKGQSWEDFLPDKVLPSPCVYQYDHELGPGDLDSKRLWSDVLDKGLGLLEALLVLLKDNHKLQECAIVFIAHSLGGLMVKQCLTQALERSRDFEQVTRVVAAFVAIATPHSRSSEPKIWEQPSLILGTQGYGRRGHTTSIKDAKRLATLCERFEKVVTNLHILTLCEAEETAIKSFFVRASKSSKMVIVPKDLCILNVRLELCQDIKANHLNICEVVASQNLEDLISRGISSVISRLKSDSRQDVPSSILDASTIADHDATSYDASLSQRETSSKGVSNQATVAISISQRDGLSHLSDFSSTKRDPILPCHIIPNAKNRDFHGRVDILDEIETKLSPTDDEGENRRGMMTLAISGPGGVGKTQVANEFAHSHIHVYEAIFWLHAEEGTKLADEFSGIAETLGLVLEGTADAKDPVVTRELVKGWLANPVRSFNRVGGSSDGDEVAWLVIFDNVDDPDLISDYLPPLDGNNGSVIITSRDNMATTPLYQVKHGIELLPMGHKDASELLLRLTWRENDVEEKKLSESIADILGGMPLALTQMAGVMVRQSLSFNDFLKRYEEEEAHGALFNLSMAPSHKRNNYGYTLASVWALEKLKYSSGLLDVMAFLDPDGIPEMYLEEAAGSMQQLSDYPTSVTAYQDARGELLKSSLIKRDRTNSKLTVHRLIQDCARTKMENDRRTRVFAAAVDILWSKWPAAEPGVRHHIARWKDCELMSAQILRLKEHYTRAGKVWKALLMNNFKFALLMNELGWYFQERGYTLEAMDCYHISQTNIEHMIKANEPQQQKPDANMQIHGLGSHMERLALLAETHNNIAGSATELNIAEEALRHFLKYNQMLIEEHKNQIAITDARLTSSYFNVGLSYIMQTQYEEAIKWLDDALNEANRLQDPAKIKSARSLALINTGLAYWFLGQHVRAFDVLERARVEREEMFGVNDRQSMITGRIWHCLGNVRQSQGHLDESLNAHERALLHFKETVGNNHHRTGNSCFKVAEHYLRLGKLHDALELLNQAVKIFNRHSCYAGEKGRAIFLKSIILKKQGLDDESKEHLEEAGSIYRALLSVKFVETQNLMKLEDFHSYVHAWGR